MTKVYHDGAGGVTRISTEHFKATLGLGINVVEVNIHREGTFTFEVLGFTRERLGGESEMVIILESGFTCGYNGEGPNGAFEALRMLGVSELEAQAVFSKQNVKYRHGELSE